MKVFSKKHNDVSPIIDRQSLFREIVDSTAYQFQVYCNKAIEITQKHFSDRRRVFNPIYVSDVCVNDCLYCGFRRSNKLFKRITLNPAKLERGYIFSIEGSKKPSYSNWRIL